MVGTGFGCCKECLDELLGGFSYSSTVIDWYVDIKSDEGRAI